MSIERTRQTEPGDEHRGRQVLWIIAEVSLLLLLFLGLRLMLQSVWQSLIAPLLTAVEWFCP